MNDQPVIVIGAGIIGTATARALQREGHAVTLIDSGEPGRATSYGNAGFIAIDHVLPLARPSTLKRVPKMLMDRDGPLTVHPPSIPALLPWMARFALAAYSQKEVQKGVDSFVPLMAEANIAWKAEIQASGLGELFRTLGALYVYESEQAFASGAEERALQEAKGTVFEIVDGNRARELAPGLNDRIVRGVYYAHGMHTINPYKVVTALAERFTADGGTLLRGRVRGFGRDGNRLTSVEITDQSLPAKAVVIAAGRASGELTRLLGFNAPLVAERGYHVMLAPRQCALRVAGEPGRARLLHHAHGGRPARGRHGRARRPAPAAVLASRRSPGAASQGDLPRRRRRRAEPLDRRAADLARLPAGDRPRASARQRLLRLRPPACRADARHRDRPADHAPDGGRGAA